MNEICFQKAYQESVWQVYHLISNVPITITLRTATKAIDLETPSMLLKIG